MHIPATLGLDCLPDSLAARLLNTAFAVWTTVDNGTETRIHCLGNLLYCQLRTTTELGADVFDIDRHIYASKLSIYHAPKTHLSIHYIINSLTQ